MGQRAQSSYFLVPQRNANCLLCGQFPFQVQQELDSSVSPLSACLLPTVPPQKKPKKLKKSPPGQDNKEAAAVILIKL